MTDSPVTLAVVIPCWNHGRLLREALNSIAAQTWQPTQVIVVDDGSTDATVAVAQADRAVTLIRQPQLGAARARNTALARVEADLVTFLDADDLWPPSSVQARVSALLEAGTDGCFGEIEEFRDPADLMMPQRPKSPARLAGSIVITRNAVERVGGFDQSLRGGEVVDWVARFDAAGFHWTQVNEVVLRRRIHSGNSSRDPKYATRSGLLEVARRSAAAKRTAP